MEWNNELTLEFLEAYEKHPVLWNSLYPGHKNKNTLQDAWTEVANELSVTMPVVALKKKKESLMSTYRTLRKKIVDSETTGSGSQDVYYPSWFAYNAIDRFIRVQNTKIPSLNSEVSLIDNYRVYFIILIKNSSLQIFNTNINTKLTKQK